MAPFLQDLPPELLDLIAEYCGWNDQIWNYGDPINENSPASLLQLRTVCRDIEQGTRRMWRNIYFETRSVALNLERLHKLQTLNKIAEFSNAVVVLEVSCGDEHSISSIDPLNPSNAGQSFLLQCATLMPVVLQNMTNIREVYFNLDAVFAETSNAVIVDCSITFSTVLLALQACEIRPQIIRAGPWMSATRLDMMLRLKQCFSQLRELRLSITQTSLANGDPGNMQLDKTLAAAIGQMNHLQTLNVALSGGEIDTNFIAGMAEKVRLPFLSDIVIINVQCKSRDLLQFLENHRMTVDSIELDMFDFTDDEAQEVFERLLKMLRDHFSCRSLRLSYMESHGRVLNFSGVHRHGCARAAGPESMTREGSEICQNLSLEGLEDVKAAFSEVLECMTWEDIPSN